MDIDRVCVYVRLFNTLLVMQPYQERGAKDKERYKKEMREYKQLKSFQAGLGSATGVQEVRSEATGMATSSSGDGDNHVATEESNPKPTSVPGIPRPFFPDPLPQTQQLVNLSPSASEQPSTQEYPQHFANSLPTNMGTSVLEQHSHLGHENVGPDVTQGPSSQRVAHQFMG